MEQQKMEDLRYPIGNFERPAAVSRELIERYVLEISELPGILRLVVEKLSNAQLDTRYRPEGWTVRQVVHHIADSHINAYVRFKWAMTEDSPTIKPYFEERWSELGDSAKPIENSLKLIESLHQRWVDLLKSMSETDFARSLNHPDSGSWTLGEMAGLYAWHSRHHTAHITKLAARAGW